MGWWEGEEGRQNFKSVVEVLVAKVRFIQFNSNYFSPLQFITVNGNSSSLTPALPHKIMSLN